MRRPGTVALSLLGAMVFGLGVASACQVPVFRFALERWVGDDYRVVMVHRGALTTEQEEAADVLRGAENANIQVESYDLENLTETQQWLVPVEEVPSGEARLFVYYPEASGIEDPFWSSALSARAAAQILSSPVREVLGEKIISGESAVWVLLESGDTGKDAAVEEALRRFATKASATLEIPDGVISQRDIASGEVDPNRDPIDMEDILRSKVPLKIAFSSMRLGRDEAPEAFFRQMLLGISGHENAAEPLVFATFGRGRVMPPIPASKLTETSFLQAASYLCGACSCGVKEDNPGIDLVMNVAWDEHLEGNLIYAEKALPPLTGAIGAGRDSVGEAGVGPVSDPGDMSPVTRNMLVLFALMGGALVVGSLVLRRSS